MKFWRVSKGKGLPEGDGTHSMLVNKELQKGANAAAGDTVLRHDAIAGGGPSVGGDPLYSVAGLAAHQGGGSREWSSASTLAQRLRDNRFVRATRFRLRRSPKPRQVA